MDDTNLPKLVLRISEDENLPCIGLLTVTADGETKSLQFPLPQMPKGMPLSDVCLLLQGAIRNGLQDALQAERVQCAAGIEESAARVWMPRFEEAIRGYLARIPDVSEVRLSDEGRRLMTKRDVKDPDSELFVRVQDLLWNFFPPYAVFPKQRNGFRLWDEKWKPAFDLWRKETEIADPQKAWAYLIFPPYVRVLFWRMPLEFDAPKGKSREEMGRAINDFLLPKFRKAIAKELEPYRKAWEQMRVQRGDGLELVSRDDPDAPDAEPTAPGTPYEDIHRRLDAEAVAAFVRQDPNLARMAEFLLRYDDKDGKESRRALQEELGISDSAFYARASRYRKTLLEACKVFTD